MPTSRRKPMLIIDASSVTAHHAANVALLQLTVMNVILNRGRNARVDHLKSVTNIALSRSIIPMTRLTPKENFL